MTSSDPAGNPVGGKIPLIPYLRFSGRSHVWIFVCNAIPDRLPQEYSDLNLNQQYYRSGLLSACHQHLLVVCSLGLPVPRYLLQLLSASTACNRKHISIFDADASGSIPKSLLIYAQNALTKHQSKRFRKPPLFFVSSEF